MTADLLERPVTDEAEVAAEAPEWDGPDPHTWNETIPDFGDKMADLARVAEVLEAIGNPQDNFGPGEHYDAGLRFLRHMQDKLKGEVAELVLNAFHQIP
jgi:hypothetical protein